MMNERIRVGIIGLGRSGWNIHADGLAELDQYHVVAAVDPDAERRAEAGDRFGCAAYVDAQMLFADPDVELVVVATPSHLHVPLGLAALEAGKHVVVEKPLARSVADVDMLIAAAEKAGRVLTCFQNNRFEPLFVAIRSVIDSGRLGDLVLIRRSIHRYARRADWQTLRKFDGGELSNTASHFLDQLLQLIGDGPIDLLADLRHTITAGDAEDHVKLVVKPETGPVIDLESSSVVATPHPAWLVAGTNGSLTTTDEGIYVRWRDPAPLEMLSVDEGAVLGRTYGLDEQFVWHEESVAVQPGSSQRTFEFYGHLARSLRDGAALYVTPESVRRQIDIIERARDQSGLA